MSLMQIKTYSLPCILCQTTLKHDSIFHLGFQFMWIPFLYSTRVKNHFTMQTLCKIWYTVICQHVCNAWVITIWKQFITCTSYRLNNAISYLAHVRAAKYCDEHVCQSVCTWGWLGNHKTELHVSSGHGSALLLRCCNKLCISGFVAHNIMFSHNGHNGTSMWIRTVQSKPSLEL